MKKILLNRDDFLARLFEIRKRNLEITIYAPEGIEPRLVEHDLERFPIGLMVYLAACNPIRQTYANAPC